MADSSAFKDGERVLPQHQAAVTLLQGRLSAPHEMFDPGSRYEYELPLPSDVVRALELEARFTRLNLGLVDGMVIAVAERRRVYRVLTTDRRDFGPIRVGPRLARPLELLP